ncbi:SRPBCC domain-containing protein [Nonomuraea sp. NPDC000554]|uniref:SRPBCC family protein n=1 Tax=Nonomuraea sp. NPDC000554 TaxID=3154259 RepID=UPI0033225D74
MPHEFEVRHEVTINATPEAVWKAISEGPGIDSWFMGHTELEPREGGRGSHTFPGEAPSGSTVTAWEPGKHLAYRGDLNEDGTFMAFEYLIEGRESGSTVLRFVHSGFLGGDWEAEHDALKVGDLQYLLKLTAYVEHFPSRLSTHNMFLFKPQVPAERAWPALATALGLDGEIRQGDKVTIAIEGLVPQDGVVDWVARPGEFVGVRTDDGLYMFVHAQDNVVVEHHAYTDIDGEAFERAWQSWLDTALV